MFTFLRNLLGRPRGSGKSAAKRRSAMSLQLEKLEDRLTPTTSILPGGGVVDPGKFIYQPFVVSGTSLYVNGTSGNDQFSFTAGASSETVTLNGQSYTVNPSQIHTIYFNGNGGSDTASLTDHVNRATAALSPHSATLGSQNYSVITSNTMYNYLYGSTGDTANLFDSAGNDTFFAGGNQAGMYDSGLTYLNVATGFTYNNGYSSHGGTDNAQFYDTPGNDVFVGMATSASMTNTANTYKNTANGFASTHASSSQGGVDTAFLYDNYGGSLMVNGSDATLISKTNSGSSYSNTATGFRVVNAYSSGNDDGMWENTPATYTLNLHGWWSINGGDDNDY
jgi:hypothetical protein